MFLQWFFFCWEQKYYHCYCAYLSCFDSKARVLLQFDFFAQPLYTEYYFFTFTSMYRDLNLSCWHFFVKNVKNFVFYGWHLSSYCSIFTVRKDERAKYSIVSHLVWSLLTFFDLYCIWTITEEFYLALFIKHDHCIIKIDSTPIYLSPSQFVKWSIIVKCNVK